jgi:hypothetical protein
MAIKRSKVQCCAAPWVSAIDIYSMAQQQLGDVIMPVAGGLVQQGLTVPVPNMEFCTIFDQSLSNFLQTSADSFAERVVFSIHVHQSRL